MCPPNILLKMEISAIVIQLKRVHFLQGNINQKQEQFLKIFKTFFRFLTVPWNWSVGSEVINYCCVVERVSTIPLPKVSSALYCVQA